MNINNLIEIIGAIIIPFLIWWVQHTIDNEKEERKLLLKEVQQKINNRSFLLEKNIDCCEQSINSINEKLKHRADIASLKYGILKDKIEDLESYLEKVNGYRRKRTGYSERQNMPTLTGNEDVETGLF